MSDLSHQKPFDYFRLLGSHIEWLCLTETTFATTRLISIVSQTFSDSGSSTMTDLCLSFQSLLLTRQLHFGFTKSFVVAWSNAHIASSFELPVLRTWRYVSNMLNTKNFQVLSDFTGIVFKAS